MYDIWLDYADIVIKSSTLKFLKTQPWKIRTGSKEKSALVQQWLIDQGMSWEHNKGIKTCTTNHF